MYKRSFVFVFLKWERDESKIMLKSEWVKIFWMEKWVEDIKVLERNENVLGLI